MLAEQIVTDAWPLPGVVERNDHEIWHGLLHILENLRLIRDLTDNFNVGLVREGCENGLSHKPGTVRHEDPDKFFHCTLPAARVSGSQAVSVRIKTTLSV